MFHKLDLKYGDKVKVKGTDTIIDGIEFMVVGIVTRHVIDTYIISLPVGVTRTMPDFGRYGALAMSEACLERV